MRIGGPSNAMELVSQLAPIDCASSRRSTVMCALPPPAVTTEYQRDSSSKRPRSSVVFAARPPTRASPTGDQTANTASRASRPTGGAPGAPGPRARRLMCLRLGRQAVACRRERTRIAKIGGLDTGHSISARVINAPREILTAEPSREWRRHLAAWQAAFLTRAVKTKPPVAMLMAAGGLSLNAFDQR